MDDQILKCIGENCKNLIEFKSSYSDNSFTEATFINFVRNTKYMESFRIDRSRVMNDKMIEVIQKHWPRLRSLHVPNCRNITSSCSHSLREMSLTELDLGNTLV